MTHIGKNMIATGLSLLATVGTQAASFDGNWKGTFRCGEGLQSGARPFSTPINMVVVGDAVNVTRKTKSVTEILNGRIASADRASLSGNGKSNTKDSSWTTEIQGKFSEGEFNGIAAIANAKGIKTRECVAQLTKVETASVRTAGPSKSEPMAAPPRETTATASEPYRSLPSTPTPASTAPPTTAPSPARKAVPSVTGIVGLSAIRPTQGLPYPTRELLLKAASTGEFKQYATPEHQQALALSVQRILMAEYRVPEISPTCFGSAFSDDVSRLLGSITHVLFSSLTDEPPDFTKTHYVDPYEGTLHATLVDLKSERNICDEDRRGRVVYHPYKAALISLGEDFTKATQAYVDAKRAQLKTDYQAAIELAP